MFLTLNFALVHFVWLVEKIESRERKSGREKRGDRRKTDSKKVKKERRERPGKKETERRPKGKLNTKGMCVCVCVRERERFFISFAGASGWLKKW